MEDKNRNIRLINGEEDKTMRLDFSPYTVEIKGKVVIFADNELDAKREIESQYEYLFDNMSIESIKEVR